MSISLKVVSNAAVFCASTNRSATVRRNRLIGTTSSSPPVGLLASCLCRLPALLRPSTLDLRPSPFLPLLLSRLRPLPPALCPLFPPLRPSTFDFRLSTVLLPLPFPSL